MTPELERMIRELHDKQAIREVVMKFARGSDRRDREVFLSCYHPDALDDRAMFTGGPEELYEWADPSHLRYYRRHQHIICNHLAEIDGDTAHAETYWMFAGMGEDDSLILSGGRYADRLEKRGGEWRIAARKTVMEWWGTPKDGAVDQEAIDAFAAVGRSAKDQSDFSYDRPLTIDPERVGIRGWI